jgi:hypothetical protein
MLFVSAALGMLLILLGGCNDDSSVTPSGVPISGIVQNDGAAQGGATVTLLQNGQPVGESQITPASGAFSFPRAASGTYVLRVTNGAVTTYYGPFVSSDVSITIDAPTLETLPTGVTVPTDGTATAVATAELEDGTPVTTPTLLISVDNLVSDEGNPAVLTGIEPSTYTVFVEEIDPPLQAIFPNVKFEPYTVTFFRAVLKFYTLDYTLTGTLTNQGTPLANTDLSFFRRSFSAGGTTVTTDATGMFSIPGLSSETYYLQAVPDSQHVAIYGPITVTTTPPGPITFDVNNGAGESVPTNGTATYVITAIENGAPTTNRLLAIVDGQSATGTSPLVVRNITGDYVKIIVTDLDNGRQAVISNLRSFGNTLYTVRIVLDSNGG